AGAGGAGAGGAGAGGAGAGGAGAGGAGAGGEERPARGSTILVVVATDAELAQAECTRVAMAAHDGLARAVRPAHGLTDGDVVFAVATGAVPLDAGAGSRGLLRAGPARAAGLGAVMAAAADAVTRSIVRGLLAAQGDAFLPSYLDRHPGRTPPS
ncbi:MAG TPA: P1 family peptidase, partial [Acidimicrobiales bacterium]|nr:P1 family peptidase [Acidimicrobiales bacterium]